MRTHAIIIKDAGGAQAVHDRLGLTDKIHTVRSWVQRNKIPSEHWKALADLGIATTDELATAIDPRREAATERDAA